MSNKHTSKSPAKRPVRPATFWTFFLESSQSRANSPSSAPEAGVIRPAVSGAIARLATAIGPGPCVKLKQSGRLARLLLCKASASLCRARTDYTHQPTHALSYSVLRCWYPFTPGIIPLSTLLYRCKMTDAAFLDGPTVAKLCRKSVRESPSVTWGKSHKSSLGEACHFRPDRNRGPALPSLH